MVQLNLCLWNTFSNGRNMQSLMRGVTSYLTPAVYQSVAECDLWASLWSLTQACQRTFNTFLTVTLSAIPVFFSCIISSYCKNVLCLLWSYSQHLWITIMIVFWTPLNLHSDYFCFVFSLLIFWVHFQSQHAKLLWTLQPIWAAGCDATLLGICYE